MNVFARLRSSSRGILVWMLLAAYACSPLAAWAQPGAQALVVPYCTGQTSTKAGSSVPRRIVLRFSGHPQVAASVVQFALPASGTQAFGMPRMPRFAAPSGGETVAPPPLAWRPPPRAPPSRWVRI